MGTLLKRGALNGRPILTHGVSTSWTNKINGQRRPPLKLTPPRPSDAKQKPHDTVKFQGMDIGHCPCPLGPNGQLDAVNQSTK